MRDEPSLDGSYVRRLPRDYSDEAPVRIDRSTTDACHAPGCVSNRRTADP
ncbi:MAG: hypothetical protein V4512_16175 [Pseudomonadota bacterium]|nr:hypothetical protein [Sphingobium sp. KCTC 72723]